MVDGATCTVTLFAQSHGCAFFLSGLNKPGTLSPGFCPVAALMGRGQGGPAMHQTPSRSGRAGSGNRAALSRRYSCLFFRCHPWFPGGIGLTQPGVAFQDIPVPIQEVPVKRIEGTGVLCPVFCTDIVGTGSAIIRHLVDVIAARHVRLGGKQTLRRRTGSCRSCWEARPIHRRPHKRRGTIRAPRADPCRPAMRKFPVIISRWIWCA